MYRDQSKLKLEGVEEMSKDTRTSTTTFTQMKDTKGTSVWPTWYPIIFLLDTRGSDTVEATKKESKDPQPVKKVRVYVV